MKSLKLFYASIFICVALFTTVHASDSKTGALLWKISGNGLVKPSYILGTFHLAPKTKLDSIPGATKALEDCEQVVGEIVMSEMMAHVQKIQQAGMMPPDTTYQMLYTEEEYEKVNDGIKEFMGIGLDQMGVLKPSMIQTTIVVFMYQQFFPNIQVEQVMDNYVQQYASAAGKTILGLENIDDQVYALFNSSSLKRQAEQLFCLFEHIEYNHDNTTELMDAYNRADFIAIQALIDDNENPCPSSQEEIDILLKNRNDNWVEKLPEIMSEKSSFIAVGAGHLVGNVGILTQLEKLGYLVDPVK